MRLPLHLDRGILTIVDADGETVCSAMLSNVDRIDAESAEKLQRLVESANAMRLVVPESRRHFAEEPLKLALKLSIANESGDPQTHFGPGPLGIVKGI